jgi:hypothetical protein
MRIWRNSTNQNCIDKEIKSRLNSESLCYHAGQNVSSSHLKVNLSHYTPRRRLGERRYSSYSFSTSALHGGEWSASRPGRDLALGKGSQVPIVKEAGWAPVQVWTQRLEEKFFRLCWGSNLYRPSRPARSQTLYWPGSLFFPPAT